jgi:DNA polymerase-3 subunit chi
MTEVLFYHLQRQPLERVLPQLLERSVERGWRVVVQAGSEERVEALDAHLWTYRDDSFPAAGTARAGETRGAADPAHHRRAQSEWGDGAFPARRRADPPDAGSYDRLVLMFNGEDDDAVAAARERWGQAKAQGFEVTYWQPDRAGPLGQEGLRAGCVYRCRRQHGDAKLSLGPPR